MKRVVLFLGAGFSAQFGLPVMRGFLQYAKSIGRLNHDDTELLDATYRAARQANAMVAGSPNNLEDILSYALMGERLGLPTVPADCSKRLRSILQRVFVLHPTDGPYWERFLPFVEWWEALHLAQDDRLDIITTNYDVAVECCLHRTGNSAALGEGFVEVTAPTVQVAGSLYGGTIPLHKLHGSVNYFARDDGQIQVEGRLARVASQHNNYLPYISIPGYRSPGDPVIVPPSFLKPELLAPLRVAWKAAANALQSATHLVVVGYSFPRSDTEMRYFFGRSLMDNIDLTDIAIVDPNASATSDRLHASESGFGNHFLSMIRPINVRWVDSIADVDALMI